MQQFRMAPQSRAPLSQLWINHWSYFINKANLTILPISPCSSSPAVPQKQEPAPLPGRGKAGSPKEAAWGSGVWSASQLWADEPWLCSLGGLHMMREPALPGGGYLGTPAASLSCGSDAVSGERVQVRTQSRGTVYLGLVVLKRINWILKEFCLRNINTILMSCLCVCVCVCMLVRSFVSDPLWPHGL